MNSLEEFNYLYEIFTTSSTNPPTKKPTPSTKNPSPRPTPIVHSDCSLSDYCPTPPPTKNPTPKPSPTKSPTPQTPTPKNPTPKPPTPKGPTPNTPTPNTPTPNTPTPKPGPVPPSPFNLGIFTNGFLPQTQANCGTIHPCSSYSAMTQADAGLSKNNTINTIALGIFRTLAVTKTALEAAFVSPPKWNPNGILDFGAVSNNYTNLYFVIGGEGVASNTATTGDTFDINTGKIFWVDTMLDDLIKKKINMSRTKGIIFDIESAGWLLGQGGNPPFNQVVDKVRTYYKTKYPDWIYVLCVESWVSTCSEKESCQASIASSTSTPKKEQFAPYINDPHMFLAPMLYGGSNSYANWNMDSIKITLDYFETTIGWNPKKIFTTYQTDSLWGGVNGHIEDIEKAPHKDLLEDLYSFSKKGGYKGMLGWYSTSQTGAWRRNSAALDYIVSKS